MRAYKLLLKFRESILDLLFELRDERSRLLESFALDSNQRRTVAESERRALGG